jgi:hypothetical protein
MDSQQEDGDLSPNVKKKRSGMLLYIFAGVGIAAVLAMIAYLIVFIVQTNRQAENLAASEPEGALVADEGGEETLGEMDIDGEDDFGTYMLTEEGVRDYTNAFSEGEIVVDWKRGAEFLSRAETDTLMASIDPQFENTLFEKNLYEEPCTEDQEDLCHVYIYKAGDIVAPDRLAGKPVYYLFVPSVGMGIFVNQFVVTFDDVSKKFVLFAESDSTSINTELNTLGWAVGRIAHTFDELQYPKEITIPGETSRLKWEASYTADRSFFSTRSPYGNIGGIAMTPSGEMVKLEGTFLFSDPEAGDVFFEDSFYYIVLPDGAVQQYELIPYFFGTPPGEEKEMYAMRYAADITWTNGNRADDVYDVAGDIGQAGCGPGVLPLTNIVNDKPWFHEDLLVEIGKTDRGEKVYELSDKATNEYYRAFFDYGYGAALYRETGEQYAADEFTEEDYQKFIDDMPLFFWKDYRGNWRSVRKIKYETLAECGKPVIYLYPEETTDVRVQVAPNGGFTHTDPVYPQGGWLVHATPNGELYNYADETAYPYLFWEGKADGFAFPEQGFVFSREDVSSGVRELLARIGLNETETDDFMEFWREKLERSPYVFVTFASERAFERSAPLRITPQPDSLLRLFMYYEPLEENRSVEPLPLRSFERHGFTVVEWGGAWDGLGRK